MRPIGAYTHHTAKGVITLQFLITCKDLDNLTEIGVKVHDVVE